MKKKIIPSIPFLITCTIVAYNWFEFITTEYLAEAKHYIALALIIINAVLYFIKQKQAILLTGWSIIRGEDGGFTMYG